MGEAEAGDLVELGEVMGAHGVRGELKVKAHNPDSDLLLDVERVTVRLKQVERVYGVEYAKPHGKGLLMALVGIDNREQARALYGAQLCVPRQALPEPDEDEFYLVDAIGADALDETGATVGKVTGFRAYPTVDVLCVAGEDGVREVPLLPHYFRGAELEQRVVRLANLSDIDVEPGSGKGGP